MLVYQRVTLLSLIAIYIYVYMTVIIIDNDYNDDDEDEDEDDEDEDDDDDDLWWIDHHNDDGLVLLFANMNDDQVICATPFIII